MQTPPKHVMIKVIANTKFSELSLELITAIYNLLTANSEETKMPPKTLPEQLRIKANMISLGEKIAWGSETSLMLEAADKIEALEEELRKLKTLVEEGNEICRK